MEISTYSLRVLYLIHLVTSSEGATVSDYDSLHAAIYQNYNKKLLPVVNSDDVAMVELGADLISINEFDGLTGELSMTFIFSLTWEEKRITWTPSVYHNISSTLVSPADMWRPQIIVRQSAKRVTDISDSSILMRLSSKGRVTWMPATIITASCSIDVTYFPFDKQKCSLTLGYSSYGSDESILVTTTEELGMQNYITNSQWDLVYASLTNLSNTQTGVIISLSLQRRSEFFVVYIIVPIISLGILNNFVFVMPATSGERTSVAITTLLSFVVYMEVIHNTVPENSEPIAYIYYYVTLLVVYSSITMVLCILSTKIYETSGDVPKCVRCIVWHATFRCRGKFKGHVVHPGDKKRLEVVQIPANQAIEESEHAKESPNRLDHDMSDIDWNTVGRTFDRCCFCILNIVFAVSTIVIIARLTSNN